MKRYFMLIALCAFGLFGVPFNGYAAQTIDAPHLNLDSNVATDDCSTCHFSTDPATGLAMVPGDTCVGCHTNDTGGYTDTSAPLAATHRGFTCQTCHNPHVSQQYGSAAALVSGTVANVVVGTNQINMDVTVTGGVGGWPATPAIWSAKSINGVVPETDDPNRKQDRGLTLWVTIGADAYSFEVKDTTAFPTIMVRGGLPDGVSIADDTSFELHYGQLLARKVSPGISYRYGTNPVTLTDPATNEPAFVNPSGTDGICQACHDSTLHYSNTVVEASHHIGEACTKCHLHSDGFVIDTNNCAACHPTYPSPPASGAHILHAGTSGYNFPCQVCHKGGMAAWKLGLDDNIQLGFNMVPLGNNNFDGTNTSYDGTPGTFADTYNYGAGYLGANGTTVTTNGSLTCSNIYCHSSGQAMEQGCLTGEIQGKANQTPAWDSTGQLNCQGCHPQIWDNTATSTHYMHVVKNYITCNNCHYGTTNDGTTITNKALHANGYYDLAPGGKYVGYPVTNIGWDPATATCANATCHSSSRIWIPEAVTCEVDATHATANIDPVIEPFDATKDAFVYANDPNTLHLLVKASDPDYLDPLKNQAFGGHDGSKALIRSVFADQCNSFQNIALSDVPNTFELTCTYSDAKLQATGGQFCWTYSIADNDARSYGNWSAADWAVDSAVTGDGLSAPVGNAAPQWDCVNPTTNTDLVIDDSMNNIKPVVIFNPATDVTLTAPYEVNVTLNVKDADYNDPAKNTYWAAQTGMPGGHLESMKYYVQINWSNEGLTSEKGPVTAEDAIQLTAIGGSKTYSFNYDQETPVVGTNDNVAVTTRNGVNPPGTAVGRNKAWIQAYVCDNHFQKVEPDFNKHCWDSGWFKVDF